MKWQYPCTWFFFCFFFFFSCCRFGGADTKHGYIDHGMCLTNWQVKNNDHDSVSLELALFGGRRVADKTSHHFLFFVSESFISVNVIVRCRYEHINSINPSNFDEKISVMASQIAAQDSFLDDIGSLSNFGYECIVNGNGKETIIFIIGGENNSRNVILWNYTKHTFAIKKNVCTVFLYVFYFYFFLFIFPF